MNIVTLFQSRVAERPDAHAIVERRWGQDRSHSFTELEADSARAAMLLRRYGIGRGDRVLVFLPVSYELYVVLLAIFRLGGVAMFLDPSAGRPHLEQCCEIGKPRALVTTPRGQLLRAVSRGVRRIPAKFTTGRFVPGAISLRRRRNLNPQEGIIASVPGDPALLTFTSGSTGRPKAAVRSHGFLIAQYEALAGALRLQSGEVDLTTLPIFLLANLAAGVTSVIPKADLRAPGEVDAGPIVRQIEQCGVTRSAGSPAFYQRMVEYCEKQDLKLAGLRRIDTGGAPVFPPLLQRMQRIAPRAEVVTVYGSTEAEPVAHIAVKEIGSGDMRSMQEGRGLLVGMPVQEVTLRILPDRFGKPIGPYTKTEFDAECLPPGEIGEIVVTGEHVLKGYMHGEGEREHKFEVDGWRWHRTGDAGYLDALGRLWLVGRCSARIEDNKGILYPFAVECAAQFMTGVRRTAMVSYKGRRLLLLEREPGCDAPTAVDAPAWAELDAVKVVKRIPVDKRHNAKVDYVKVQQLLQQLL